MTSNPIHKYMPLLARHAGDWRGTYRFIKPDLSLLDQYNFHITVEFPQGEKCDYRQTSRYSWADGRTQTLVFEASLASDKLVWDSEHITGRLWAVDETTLYLTFFMKHDPDLVSYEMIQLSACGQHRARTWHWLRGGVLEKLTLVDERRA